MSNQCSNNQCQGKRAVSGLGVLALRLLLAWEFFQSGLTKLEGTNWFDQIQDQFPFPFNLLPADLNWGLSMGAELILPFLLVFGLLTRFSSLVLLTVLFVAWYSLHAASGYNVCDNGYQLVLTYSVMLLPLLMQGAGSLSVDAFLRSKFSHHSWSKFL